jgi:hypothetical protein
MGMNMLSAVCRATGHKRDIKTEVTKQRRARRKEEITGTRKK